MDMCDGRFQMVDIRPESLLISMQWREILQSPHYHNNLVALVVDKAHCVRFQINILIDYIN